MTGCFLHFIYHTTIPWKHKVCTQIAELGEHVNSVLGYVLFFTIEMLLMTAHINSSTVPGVSIHNTMTLRERFNLY